ncbi:MAG: TatD family hydrolase, partial [Victivallaceae bacterium]|nr:TatD family hydrolase [Victivallaceae bacterium]
MKSSTRELSKIEFIDFHTHKQIALPKTLSVISIELADLKNLVLKNSDYRFFSVGLHPWRLPANTNNLEKDLETLRQALQTSEVIAIGEVGLDRLLGPDMEIQKLYFTGALKLAKELNKTLIVHCVRCYPELLSMKKQFAPDVNMLVHAYNGKIEILKQLLKQDCYVSFAAAAPRRDDICGYIRQKPDCLQHVCLE